MPCVTSKVKNAWTPSALGSKTYLHTELLMFERTIMFDTLDHVMEGSPLRDGPAPRFDQLPGLQPNDPRIEYKQRRVPTCSAGVMQNIRERESDGLCL